MLWFLQHYLWDLRVAPSVDHGAAPRLGRAATSRSTAAFADAVLEELEREPDATVFFHDYHLYLAPRFVRERAPDALLAHFVHIPWPQPDYWHVLPEPIRRAIHDGLLANDVVGFHTRALAAELPARARGHRRRRRRLRATASSRYDERARRSSTAHPISVDPAEFDELAASDAGARRRSASSSRAGPRSSSCASTAPIPSKNIVRGFRAFELYLDAHPEMHGRVGMLALLDPSRQDIPEYAEYLGAIQREARRVNDRFQQDGWTPIDLQIEDNFTQSVAAYKQFDVLLVNAIFDGLNLVAKEAPLVNERDGVLDPVRERRRARGARRVGAVGQPVRRRRAGRGDPRRRSRCRRRSGARGSRRSARTCASTTSPRWIAAQLADLDRRRGRCTPARIARVDRDRSSARRAALGQPGDARGRSAPSP